MFCQIGQSYSLIKTLDSKTSKWVLGTAYPWCFISIRTCFTKVSFLHFPLNKSLAPTKAELVFYMTEHWVQCQSSTWLENNLETESYCIIFHQHREGVGQGLRSRSQVIQRKYVIQQVILSELIVTWLTTRKSCNKIGWMGSDSVKILFRTSNYWVKVLPTADNYSVKILQGAGKYSIKHLTRRAIIP